MSDTRRGHRPSRAAATLATIPRSPIPGRFSAEKIRERYRDTAVVLLAVSVAFYVGSTLFLLAITVGTRAMIVAEILGAFELGFGATAIFAAVGVKRRRPLLSIWAIPTGLFYLVLWFLLFRGVFFPLALLAGAGGFFEVFGGILGTVSQETKDFVRGQRDSASSPAPQSEPLPPRQE